MSDYDQWGVYEHRAGIAWNVHPPTRENAERQALLITGEGETGTPYEAMPLATARNLANAFNHGRAFARRQEATR